MGALFGSLTSLSIATADLFGRQAANRQHVLSIMTVIHVTAGCVLVGALPFFNSQWDAADFLRGTVAGLCTGGALAAYFTSMNRSGSVIAAPTVAVMSALMPFGYTVLTGHSPSDVQIAGALTTACGLALVTGGSAIRARNVLRAWQAITHHQATGAAVDERERHQQPVAEATQLPSPGSPSASPTEGSDDIAAEPAEARRRSATAQGIFWALVGGCGYGVGLSVLIDTTEQSGMYPAVAQRAASVVLLVLIVSTRRVPLLPARGTVGTVVLSGACATGASMFYLLGVQADAPPAVVTASLFPVLSVAVGMLLFRDRATAAQLAGMGVAMVGVVMVVAAGAA